MGDPPPYLDTGDDTGDDTGVEFGRGASTSRPRWVKVFGVIALVLVVMFLLLRAGVFGGEHGPGRHTPAGDRSAVNAAEGPDG